MIRLFASDLDGTLLGAMHEVSMPVRRALCAVAAAGCHFAVATGRTFRSCDDFGFAGLPIEVVCANGAIVLDREGTTIRFCELDPGFLEEMLQAFPQAPFLCVGRRHSFVTVSQEVHAAGFSRGGGLRRIVGALRAQALYRGYGVHNEMRFDQTPSQVLAHSICKVNCRISDSGMARELSAFLAERKDRVVNAPFNPSIFEITATGIDKGEAVEWLAGRLGVAPDEVAAYGDGGNDAAMLARFAPFGHSYATRAAMPEARAAAAHAIGSNVLYAVPRHIMATLRAQAASAR